MTSQAYPSLKAWDAAGFLHFPDGLCGSQLVDSLHHFGSGGPFRDHKSMKCEIISVYLNCVTMCDRVWPIHLSWVDGLWGLGPQTKNREVREFAEPVLLVCALNVAFECVCTVPWHRRKRWGVTELSSCVQVSSGSLKGCGRSLPEKCLRRTDQFVVILLLRCTYSDSLGIDSFLDFFGM